MIGDCENIVRQAVRRGLDFETKNVSIEMKVFIPELDAGYGCMERKFQQSIKQVIEYVTDSSEVDAEGKRIILFVVGRQGISKEIKKSSIRKLPNY